MEQSGFVVGIELGTSKIVALLARRNEANILSVLASESVSSEGCVRGGEVYNIDEAAGKVKRLIQLLENKTDKKIAKAYFSVSGKSLLSLPHTETQMFDSATNITVGMVDNLERRAKSFQPDNDRLNYGVVSPQIYLDGNIEKNPENKTALLLEGKFQIITGSPKINHTITTVASKAGIGIAGTVVGVIAASALLLSPDDKEKGCALVDFGAGTTNLSIYKHGILQFFRTIPFGGRTVTRDVQSLGFIEAAAEDYKIRYGKVGKDRNRNLTEERAESGIDIKELNRVIQLRYEEIVLNVLHQIKASGFAETLPEGIVLTGMASNQTGLEEFIQQKTGFAVRRAVPNRIFINNVAELVNNAGYSAALSLLLLARVNCEKIEEKPLVPELEVSAPQSEPQSEPEPTPVVTPEVQTQPARNQFTEAPKPASVQQQTAPITPEPKPETEKPDTPQKKGSRFWKRAKEEIGSLFKDDDNDDDE